MSPEKGLVALPLEVVRVLVTQVVTAVAMVVATTVTAGKIIKYLFNQQILSLYCRFFKCDSGRCISIAWTCDRDDDCQDGENGLMSSDERNCSFACSEDQYKCLNGDCIPGSWKCDGTPDCDDASDEPITCPLHQCVEDLEFKCNNSGRCIPKTWVCDGVNDW